MITGKKYRFMDLTGNQLNLSLLKRSINNNTFRQFTIFSGVLGTGKSTCARISALALTCENPENGEPCCMCDSCRTTMKAFDVGVDSPYVQTVNAAKITTRDEVNKLAHDIFDLQGSMRNRVFIIEEAHALTKVDNAQTVFLSELDSMPANVYVMFSTTRLFDLTEELKSRAEIYTFGRLSDLESKQLLHDTAEQKGFSILEEKINLIVKYGKGIPRNLLKALDYTIDNGVNLAELRAHLQIIDDSQLVQLFESMISPQIQVYSDLLDLIKTSVSTQDLLYSVKSFLVQVAFVIESDITGTFNKDEVATIKRIFTRDSFYKIVSLLDNSSRKISDSDVDLLLLHIRMILQNRNTAAIVTESAKVGSVEKDSTEEIKAVSEKTLTTAPPKKITLNAIKKYQGG